MKKRLLFVSLFLVSILVISGCTEFSPKKTNIIKREVICSGGEVSVWGMCYPIETTTSIFIFEGDIGTADIPSEICELTNLINLFVTGYTFNQITGSIPECICDLNSLRILAFPGNQLTGSLPECIGNMPNLGQNPGDGVDLSGNQLNGNIPESICNIEYLALGNNNFCPPFPECLTEEQLQGGQSCSLVGNSGICSSCGSFLGHDNFICCCIGQCGFSECDSFDCSIP